jgi:ribokinase
VNAILEIAVVGSVNADLRISVTAIPSPGETVRGGPTMRFNGGKGANQAVAVARLGRSVSLVGAVGSDEVSTELVDSLVAEEIDVTHLQRLDGNSGQAFVLVDPDGENAIVVAAGANALVDADLIRRAGASIASARIVLAQLEISVSAVLEAARLSTGTFLLNPAPATPLPDELWELVDVVVPNRGELAQLTGASLPTTIGEVVRLARKLPCSRVLVTLGGGGVVVVDGDTVHRIKAPELRPIDTTGAGDCFCGALADGLADGLSLVDAATFAVRAAAFSVMVSGAQASMPTRSQVLAAPEPTLLLGRWDDR